MASNLEFPPLAMTSASNTYQGTHSDGTYVATSSSTYYDLSAFAFAAFDKVLGTGYQQYWRSAESNYDPTYIGTTSTYIDGVQYFGEWLQIFMPNAMTLKSYRIAAAPDTLLEAPKAWRLAGSMDGATWYTLDSRQNITFTNNTYNTYNLPQNQVSYQYFRIVVLLTGAPNDLGVATIGEVRLFGALPYGVKDGAIEMAFYNQQYFPTVTADDMVIRTTDPSQKIHFGTLSNSLPALTISSNSMIIGSNAYIMKRMAVGKSNAEYDLDVIGNINFTGNLYRNGQFYAGDTIVAGDGIWNSNEYGVVYSGANVGVHVPVPEYRIDIRAGLGPGSNYKGVRIATEASNDVPAEALVLSENAGLSNARHAMAFHNTNIDYTKARIWTETGADYSNTKFGIEVADSNQVLQSRVVVDVEGKVGIGTDQPEEQLHVEGNAVVTSNILIGGSLTTASAIQFSGIIIGKNTGTTANFSPFSVPGVSNEDGGALSLYGQCNEGSGIRILNANLEEIARFTNQGQFGLGDATPGDILSIEDSNPRIAVYSSTGYVAGATSALALFDTNSNHGFEFVMNKDSNMMYLQRYAQAFTPSNLIAFENSNGNIGIQNMNPGAPLVVSGPTNAGVIKVTNSTNSPNDTWWMGYTLGTGNSADANDRVRIGAYNTPNNTGELFVTTGLPGVQTERLRVDQYGRVGISSSTPSNAFLDVNSNMNLNVAMFGEKTPVTILNDPPAIGFNAYQNAGWKRARGYQGQSRYAAMMELSPSQGQLRFVTTNARLNEADAFTSNCVMRMDASTSNIHVFMNSIPSDVDQTNGTLPLNYNAPIVIDSMYSLSNGSIGKIAGGLEFRGRSSNQVWSLGHIVGTVDPLSNEGFKGGLGFYTQPGSADTNIGWLDDRTRGDASRLSMMLSANQDALFYGNVGIGTNAAPSATLHVQGDIQYSGVMKTSNITRMTPVYIRGTGLNNNADRLVKLGDNQVAVAGRGLCLTIVNAADHSLVSSVNYDTYNVTTESDNLALALDAITRDSIGILTSFDAFERRMTNTLRDSAARLGLTKLAGMPAAPTGHRNAYCAIFKGSGVSTTNTTINHQVIEVCEDENAAAAFATIGTYLIEDSIAGVQVNNSLVSGDATTSIPAVFVGSNDNVGIGTIYPTYPLHIHRTSGFAGMQFTTDTDATKFLHVGMNNNWHFLWGYGAHPMSFGTAGAEQMRISSNGLVGMGTTSTAFGGRLHVAGNALIGVDTGASALIVNDIAGAKWKIATGAYALTFSRHTGSTATNYTSWEDHIIFGSNGMIGIGGVTPNTRLQIYTPNSYDGDIIRLNAKAAPTLYQLQMSSTVETGIVKWVYNMINNGTTYNNMLVFDRGNIGLGNATPGDRLVVDASIHVGTSSGATTNNHVKNTTWKYGGVTVYGSQGGNLAYNISTGADTGGWRWRFVDGTAATPGNDYFYVLYTSGNYYFKGTAVSDRRIKENVKQIDPKNALAKIEMLQGVTYNPKNTDNTVDPNVVRGGFIAQEVREVLPELVSHDKQVEETVPDTAYKAAYAVDYNGILAYLTEAVKELSQQNKELRHRLEILEQRSSASST